MLILYYQTFAWLISIHDPTHEKSRTARCQTQIIKVRLGKHLPPLFVAADIFS